MEEHALSLELQDDAVQTCLDCGDTFNVNIDSDDKIARLKKLQPAIDGGLNID